MNDETIVAIYDTPAHAQLAVADLKMAGIPDSAISVHGDYSTVPSQREGFWASLFGGTPDRDTAVYDRSVSSGSSVVTVKAPATQITSVVEILDSHSPIDIDERATGYGLTTPSVTSRQPLGAAQTVQLAEENLAVGKRVVNHGTTRIHRYVVETPVDESVSLHRETVTLERHPVVDGRPVTDNFADKTIEMTETAEEAVVAKTAHVYEEVGLRKSASDHVETIHDTLRKEEVDVEHVPGTTIPGVKTDLRAKV